MSGIIEPWDEDLHSVKLMFGDPHAVGLQYIRDLAKFLTDKANRVGQAAVSVREILETAQTYQVDNVKWGPTVIWRGGNAFMNAVIDDIFWEHYQNYTGVYIPYEYRNNFVSYGSST